jgi:cytochrome bd ubiquinol oxidase subunit I
VGALLFLPFMGYLYAYELCDYDASICPYMMADQLSMFFEMQGAMVGLIFLGSNYYIWLSMKRVEGVERVRMSLLTVLVMVALPFVMTYTWTIFPAPDPKSLAVLIPLILIPVVFGRLVPLTVSSLTVIKVGFLMVVIGNAIWMTPHGFVATQALATEQLELPSDWSWLALMPAKNSAAFTLVFVTVVNYILYNRAIRQGTIVWGKIDFTAQFVLVFLAFSMIWTMGLMGAIRSLLRKYFHTYNLVPDFTAESFTPTLSYSAWTVTGITLAFYLVVSFAIIVTLRVSDAKAVVPEGKPVPAGAK